MVGMDQKDSFYVHKPVAIPQVQFLNKVIRSSLLRLVPIFQTAQKTVEIPTGAVLGRFRPDSADTRVMIPQLQFSDKEVDMPVILGSRRAENCELFTVAVPGRC